MITPLKDVREDQYNSTKCKSVRKSRNLEKFARHQAKFEDVLSREMLRIFEAQPLLIIIAYKSAVIGTYLSSCDNGMDSSSNKITMFVFEKEIRTTNAFLSTEQPIIRNMTFCEIISNANECAVALEDGRLYVTDISKL